MSSFHGNFFVRSTDLLTMPAVPQDQSYAIEMEIDEPLTDAKFVVFQTVVLHTTSLGESPYFRLRWRAHSLSCERRIRVITLALPTTTSLSEVYASADQVALATFFACKAVERSLTHKLEDARDLVVKNLIDLLAAYKNTMSAAGPSAQLACPDNIKMLPALLLGLLKNVRLPVLFYEDSRTLISL